jgi:hypothetical protein
MAAVRRETQKVNIAFCAVLNSCKADVGGEIALY